MPPADRENDGGGEGSPIIIDTDSEAEGDDDEERGGRRSQSHAEQVGQDGGAGEDENDGYETCDQADDEDANNLEGERNSTGATARRTVNDDGARLLDRSHRGDNCTSRTGGSRSRSPALKVRSINGVDRKEAILDSTAARVAADVAIDPKKWGKIESMEDITKSPYEAPECAEIGESWFERLKHVLTPVVVRGKNEVSPELVRPCGEKLANSIFTAHQQIGRSGVLYSPMWVEGKIRDVECGWLPKKLLLLCLHEHRFLKADERVLHAIVHNLQTGKLVKTALKSWGLADAFLTLSVNNIFSYNKKKADCYKCEIFVARAFSINDILQIDPIMPDGPLLRKIKACLSIMSRHVKANPHKLAQRQQALEERNKRRTKAGSKTTGLGQNCSDSEDHVQNRGRIKGPLSEIIVTMDGDSGGSGSAANESAVTADSHPIASGSDRKREREERHESLLVMLGIVQEQHARMGQTIEFLRTRIEENINATREEMKEVSVDERDEKRRRSSSDRKDWKGPSTR
jgi:hypothetical protein